MSFDRSYPNRKDRRAPYHGSRAFDATCRPHGGCPWCKRNRRHKHARRLIETADEIMAEIWESNVRDDPYGVGNPALWAAYREAIVDDRAGQDREIL